MLKPNFVLIGAAGYVAPKHMRAIKDVGGNLIAMVDPCESVGVIDNYFRECRYFNEFERFDRFCEKQIAAGNPIDYVSICSPNYLHDAHCRWAMRIGADAICEKPLVVHERNLDGLLEVQKRTKKTVYNVLQLRHHTLIDKVRKQLAKKEIATVKVRYFTPRGAWYLHTWKGDERKSGGLLANIGIHIFDLLIFLFGDWTKWEIDHESDSMVCGQLYLKEADVNFELSINPNNDPTRELWVDGQLHRITNSSFLNLHTRVYERILAGYGWCIEDARPAIRLVESIRYWRD